ncbi:2S albumin [Forsythia ovata]|uniref:2S albumin n=1 Tax=Forsythia ovata TaxID=205694 RepID=A0ABD1X6Q7_9LAMI
MGRFIGFAVTFTVLCAAVMAGSNYYATITTVERNDANPGLSQRCQQEIQKQQQLNSCQQYLRQSSKFTEGQGGWREEFPRCCEQLEQIDEQCRCEGIKQVVQQQKQRRELQGREMREMLETAQSLPSLCRFNPPQRCEIPTLWY